MLPCHRCTVSCCRLQHRLLSALCLETASLPAAERPHEVIIRALVVPCPCYPTHRFPSASHGQLVVPLRVPSTSFLKTFQSGERESLNRRPFFSRHLHQVVAARCPLSWWLTDCSYREPSRSESANRASTSPARFQFNKPSNCPATLGFIEGS